MTIISRQTFFCLQMCLKSSETFVLRIMSSIHLENYTAPGLAWNAALRVTKVEIELLRNVNMLLMIEKGIQGGISMILNRFAQGNNEYLGEAYNETKPTKPTTYLDAKNLYGWAICEPPLLGGFR